MSSLYTIKKVLFWDFCSISILWQLFQATIVQTSPCILKDVIQQNKSTKMWHRWRIKFLNIYTSCIYALLSSEWKRSFHKYLWETNSNGKQKPLLKHVACAKYAYTIKCIFHKCKYVHSDLYIRYTFFCVEFKIEETALRLF